MRDKHQVHSSITELREYLVMESLFGNTNDNDIKHVVDDIMNNMIHSYDHYRHNIPALLDVAENNEEKIFTHLFRKFYEEYTFFIKNTKLSEFDKNIFNHSVDESKNISDLQNEFLKQRSDDQIISISDPKFNVDNFDIDYLKFILSLLHSLVMHQASKIQWDIEDISTIYTLMLMTRPVAYRIEKSDYYYLLFGVIIDRLNTSGYFQKAKDISEEIMISSSLDNVAEYGFYLSFRAFSNQSSSIAGIIYGILCLLSVKNKKNGLINSKLFVEIIWESTRFFRNIEMHKMVDHVYNLSISKDCFEPHERRQMFHAYISSKMQLFEKDSISIFEDFLNQHREDLIKGGQDECIPWLIAIYNINKLYGDDYYLSSSLPFYTSLFESIVPYENIEKYKIVIFSQSEKIKDYYKQSLSMLNQTRYKSDFTKDVSNAMMMANRLISYAYENNDFEAFLLAMIVCADFSLIFKEKFGVKSTPLSYVETYNIFDSFFENIEDNIKNIILSDKDRVVILGVSNGIVHQLLHENEYTIEKLENWTIKNLNLWNNEEKEKLVFQTSKKAGNIRLVFPEEHMDEGNIIKHNLSFSKLNINHNQNGILMLVKDIDISSFPHNLIIDNKNEFILLQQPIINILSIQWLMNYKPFFTGISKGFDKSIWIPTEDNDWPILQINSKLEANLMYNNFKIYNDSILKNPLNSDLNIVIAHGSSNIKSFYALYTNDEKAFLNISNIIGSGKLLILFVCHAGSAGKSHFDNKLSSFVRLFLESGYEAVIAPFWALSIDIPPIWLPVFMEELNSGKAVSESFQIAACAVSEKYPTPAAWGCLHLYGNPYLKINNDAVDNN